MFKFHKWAHILKEAIDLELIIEGVAETLIGAEIELRDRNGKAAKTRGDKVEIWWIFEEKRLRREKKEALRENKGTTWKRNN